MTDDRWRQISAIYHAALERNAEERDAYVLEACAGDDRLREEVEALLAADREPAVIDEPVLAGAAEALGSRSGPSLIGVVLGGYKITGFLGAGGMGEVFRARDTTLGREVAIKVLPTVWWWAPDRRARFDREARMLASLNHPNIGGIYDVVEEKGLRALVLELVDGETLAERLSRAGKAGLPLQEALSIAIQIADALAAAHRIGIVHRDLKPSNVILAKAGGARQGSPQAKLLDFGIAKATRWLVRRRRDHHADNSAAHSPRNAARDDTVHGTGAARRARS